MFMLSDIATHDRKPLSGNLHNGKELWLHRCLGVEPRKTGSHYLKARKKRTAKRKITEKSEIRGRLVSPTR
jgi:hypothetical protein